jgi:hypothetical protein
MARRSDRTTSRTVVRCVFLRAIDGGHPVPPGIKCPTECAEKRQTITASRGVTQSVRSRSAGTARLPWLALLPVSLSPFCEVGSPFNSHLSTCCEAAPRITKRILPTISRDDVTARILRRRIRACAIVGASRVRGFRRGTLSVRPLGLSEKALVQLNSAGALRVAAFRFPSVPTDVQ